MEKDFNGYELSRNWFDFCFENPDKVTTTHTAMYFFIIEHCNRLGWKDKFGLPMSMTMDALGIKNYRTYKKAFTDLILWGFILSIEESKNQYSATIIAIVKNTIATTKALSKATQSHSQKQSNVTASIDKPNNLITNKLENASGEVLFEIENLENPVKFPTWREEAKEFLADEYLIQQYVRNKKLQRGEVIAIMKEFIIKLNLGGDFKKCSGIKIHFQRSFDLHYGSKVPKNYNQGVISNAFIEPPKNYIYEGNW